MPRPRKIDADLPPCVYRKHGAYYYVRQNRWVRLADERAEAIRLIPLAEASIRSIDGVSAQELDAHIKQMLRGSRARARSVGLGFDLSEDLILTMIRKAKGRCAVTGAPFSFAKYGLTEKRPFAPSIDRIDASRGYTRNNCRVVCSIANLAMNAWGEGALRDLMRSYTGGDNGVQF